MSKKSILILAIFAAACQGSRTDPSTGKQVAPPCGPLKGTVEKSRNGRLYHAFRGIPYGKVAARFMDSMPADPWKDLKDAGDFGPSCLQLTEGSEDCLCLNVYTPLLPGDPGSPDKLPVLFWIHGGGFYMGSSSMYLPDYFMDENTIIVTVNYRLGVFGFLNMGLDEAPGNQGLKDQILALKWVRNNIGAFNGDKNKVVIFGESAGAASVSLLLLSPLTKGLFRAAISQSGTALCPWAVNERSEQFMNLVVDGVNCSSSGGGKARSKREKLECLKKVDADDFLNLIPQTLAPEDLGTTKDDTLRAMGSAPSLENNRVSTPKSHKAMPDHPKKLLQSGQFPSGAPWIIGVNAMEGFLFSSQITELLDKASTSAEHFKKTWSAIAPDAFSYKFKHNKDAITSQLIQLYFKDLKQVHEGAQLAFGDRQFLHCSIATAMLWAKKNPTYLYMFDKTGIFSLMTAVLGGEAPPGPTHADDLAAQWRLSVPGAGDDFGYIGPNHSDFGFSSDFVRLATSFAKTSQPPSSWNSKPLNWTPIPADLDSISMVHLTDSANSTKLTSDFTARFKFWDSI